jgi:hypothetical protein
MLAPEAQNLVKGIRPFGLKPPKFSGPGRPQEAPYKVSLAKIQIFVLKGEKISGQKVENMIRVIT